MFPLLLLVQSHFNIFQKSRWSAACGIVFISSAMHFLSSSIVTGSLAKTRSFKNTDKNASSVVRSSDCGDQSGGEMSLS